jgi:hypothetical protein
MIKFLTTFLIVLFLLIRSVTAQEQFTPEVDLSLITSYESYNKASNEAWVRYDRRQSDAWQAYDDAANAAFGEYYDIERAALLAMRTANYEQYLKWLDAREINDFRRQDELERTVPAIIDYKEVTGNAHAKYETAKNTAHQLYEATKALAHDVYEVEKDLALKAYRALQK